MDNETVATRKEPRTGVETGLFDAIYIAGVQEFSLGQFLMLKTNIPEMEYFTVLTTVSKPSTRQGSSGI